MPCTPRAHAARPHSLTVLLLAAACSGPAPGDDGPTDDPGPDASSAEAAMLALDARQPLVCPAPSDCVVAGAMCEPDGCGVTCVEASPGVLLGLAIACTRLETCAVVDSPYGEVPACEGLGRGTPCQPAATPASCTGEVQRACVDGRVQVQDCGTAEACWHDGTTGGCRATPEACAALFGEWSTEGPCCDELTAAPDGHCFVPEGGSCAAAPAGACEPGTRCISGECAVPSCVETGVPDVEDGDACGDLDGVPCCLAVATCTTLPQPGGETIDRCCVPTGIEPRDAADQLITSACCSGGVDAQFLCT